MNRGDFVNKAIRYLLFGLLGLLTVIIGERVVSGSDCNACPGKGICLGESDCDKYSQE